MCVYVRCVFVCACECMCLCMWVCVNVFVSVWMCLCWGERTVPTWIQLSSYLPLSLSYSLSCCFCEQPIPPPCNCRATSLCHILLSFWPQQTRGRKAWCFSLLLCPIVYTKPLTKAVSCNVLQGRGQRTWCEQQLVLRKSFECPYHYHLLWVLPLHGNRFSLFS